MVAAHPKAKTIVFVIDSFAGGGAERVVVDLINNWPKTEYKVVLLVQKNTGPYKKLLDDSIEVIVPKKPPKIFGFYAYANDIRKKIDLKSVAVIVSHLTGNNKTFLRLKAIGFFNCPIIAVEHNNIVPQFNNKDRGKFRHMLARLETAWLYTFADKIVAVSEGVKKGLVDYLKVSNKNVVVIKNPIDFSELKRRLNSKPKDELVDKFDTFARPVIITAGRLVEQKNYSLLISAFEKLSADDRGTLLIFGEGDERKLLEQKVRKLGLNDSVFMPGFVDNIWYYFAHSDVFALSSKWEGFPLTLIEAIACGLVAVATDCKYGPSEIVTEKDGVLVPSFEIDDFAAGLLKGIKLAKIQRKPILPDQGPMKALSAPSVAEQYAMLVAQVVRAET